MKGSKVTFQLPFMAENDKKFSAKRFFNLSRTIFQSQPNVFPFSAKRNEARLKDTWNILQDVIYCMTVVCLAP